MIGLVSIKIAAERIVMAEYKKRPPMLWVTPQLARALPLVKGFEPVYTYDQKAGAFTDVQQTEDGAPVWQAEALFPQGWGRSLEPVQVRMTSPTKPAITPDPARVIEAMGLATAQAHRGGEG